MAQREARAWGQKPGPKVESKGSWKALAYPLGQASKQATGIAHAVS